MFSPESGIFRIEFDDQYASSEETEENDDDSTNEERATGSDGSHGSEGSNSNNSISTVGDAVETMYNRMQVQINLAVEQGVAFNTSIRGDSQTRNAFYTLLPTTHQRNLFLRIASNQTAWPRLRSLFGAPPYSFLLPQDAYILNATGIARSRSNMAHEDHKIQNYTQFGTGQLVDEYDREYRVVDATISEHDLLPSSRESLSSNNKVHLVVRIQKRSKQERIRRLKDISLRKTMMFPSLGETILLKQTKKMLRLQGVNVDSDSQTAFRVLQVKPRDLNASTASILAART